MMKIECSSCKDSVQHCLHTNPELHLSGIPRETVSLVLIAENPDTIRYHWVVYNVPVVEIIEEHFQKGINAVNDFAQHDFVVPDPDTVETEPRLIFTVFAIDVVLNIGGGKGGDDILKAIQGHILDYAFVECRFPVEYAMEERRRLFDMSYLPPGVHD